MSFKVYIPARYGATRLPGKPLREVAGKPIIQHVWERAMSSGAAEVVVATDDARIADAVRDFGGLVCMTADHHPSGTDRIAEATASRNERADTCIVNLQGDEPSMPPAVIRQVAELLLAHREADIASICEPLLREADWRDPNQVKVVRDIHDRALYFSRAPIPHPRDGAPWSCGRDYRRHVGIYAYTVRYLQEFVTWPAGSLETVERLEQLRALAHGARIRVADAVMSCGIGIDTPEDLARFAAVESGA